MFLAITIDLDPNVAQIGPLLITWHGIFSVLGIVAAVRVSAWLGSAEGISADRIYDLAVWMVVAGIIGARLLFVWENYHLFVGQWQRALLLTEGGISQWGGIFGGLIGAYLWCRRQGFPYLKIIDLAGPATAIGFAIGRIGDVINGEHHAIASNLPWAVIYVNEHTLGQPGRAVHPEVAYELVYDVIVFLVAVRLWKPMKARFPDGVTGLIWLAVYAAGRTLLSFLREDPVFWGLRQAQWAGIAMIVIAAVAIPLVIQRARRRPPAEVAVG